MFGAVDYLPDRYHPVLTSEFVDSSLFAFEIVKIECSLHDVPRTREMRRSIERFYMAVTAAGERFDIDTNAVHRFHEAGYQVFTDVVRHYTPPVVIRAKFWPGRYRSWRILAVDPAPILSARRRQWAWYNDVKEYGEPQKVAGAYAAFYDPKYVHFPMAEWSKDDAGIYWRKENFGPIRRYASE